MNTVFDIKKMGAMGDGKTDDTAVIQSALDQAAECMGKVIVPPGRYLTKKLNKCIISQISLLVNQIFDIFRLII